MTIRNVVLVLGTMIGACGCGPTYYRVTDPTTNRAYFTTELREKDGGSVQLKEAATGKMVTLQNSEIQTITKEQFETGKVRSALSEPDGNTNPASR